VEPAKCFLSLRELFGTIFARYLALITTFRGAP
jgi:hypothetical protein